MPYLLSRTKTNGAQFDHDCNRRRSAIADISELISHGAAEKNDAEPEEQRKGSEEFRARRCSSGRIPLRHFREKHFLIRRGIDPQQQKKDQFCAEERIAVSLAGLSDQ